MAEPVERNAVMTKYQKALDLFLEGKSHKQIGRAIGSTVSSVAGLLHYARHKAVNPTMPRNKHAPGSDGWWKARGY